MIQLINKSDNYIPKLGDVSISRPSVLGNPFSWIPNSRAEFAVKNRAEAIARYKEWLPAQDNPEIKEELKKIGDLNLRGGCRLICHCVPLPCHGAVIREEVWKRCGFRVAVIGSRNFTDRDFLFKKLDDAYEKFPYFSKIVSGGAIGADILGESWANKNNIKTQIFKPDWKTCGKAAGFIRNKLIVQNADVVFAFWVNRSNGTADSLRYAKEIGVPCKVFEFSA